MFRQIELYTSLVLLPYAATTDCPIPTTSTSQITLTSSMSLLISSTISSLYQPSTTLSLRSQFSLSSTSQNSTITSSMSQPHRPTTSSMSQPPSTTQVHNLQASSPHPLMSPTAAVHHDITTSSTDQASNESSPHPLMSPTPAVHHDITTSSTDQASNESSPHPLMSPTPAVHHDITTSSTDQASNESSPHPLMSPTPAVHHDITTSSTDQASNELALRHSIQQSAIVTQTPSSSASSPAPLISTKHAIILIACGVTAFILLTIIILIVSVFACQRVNAWVKVHRDSVDPNFNQVSMNYNSAYQSTSNTFSFRSGRDYITRINKAEGDSDETFTSFENSEPIYENISC